MFGINVRVHPLFWLVGAILCYDLIEFGIQWVLLAMFCVFVSILLHEMGHVVVGRMFGSHGYIVLYALGGLAFESSRLDKRWQRIAVYFAGPGVQFILYGILRLLFPYLPLPSDRATLLGFLNVYEFFLWINLAWPILNLLPIWPLDGGQISRELFTAGSPRNGVRLSIQLSITVAGLLALH